MTADRSFASTLFERMSSRTSFMSNKDCRVAVQLLDDSEQILQEFKRGANAQVILDYVCDFLSILEKDYFGLRYQDASRNRYWLDLNKPICRQLRGDNIGLRFRVRYYPSDPTHLKEEITRYYLFAQLQRDLLHGRLFCPQSDAAVLAALSLQSVVGDYDPKVHKEGYVSEYRLLLKQTAKIEEKIAEAHKLFKGLTPEESELEFLKVASKLDTYGFDPFTVKDPADGKTVYVGVTHRGIYVYRDNIMIHHINWNDLEKVDYFGKKIYIIPKATYVSQHNNEFEGSNDNSKSKSPRACLIKYACPSATFAKHLWRHILSQKAFFTENDAKHVEMKYSKPRIPHLLRGSSFRFPTSRVLHEIEADTGTPRTGPPPNFTRYSLKKQDHRQNLSFTSSGLYHTMPAVHVGKTGRENSTIVEESLPAEDTHIVKENEMKIKKANVLEELKQQHIPVEVITATSPPPGEGGIQVADDSESPSILPPMEEVVLPKLVPLCASTPVRDDGDFLNNHAQTSEPSSSKNVANEDGNSKGEPLKNPPSTRIQPVLHSGNSPASTSKSLRSSTLSNSASVVFFVSLLALLLVAIAIALFENDESWLKSFPSIELVRHRFYEPARQFLLQRYNELFPRLQ